MTAGEPAVLTVRDGELGLISEMLLSISLLVCYRLFPFTELPDVGSRPLVRLDHHNVPNNTNSNWNAENTQ